LHQTLIEVFLDRDSFEDKKTLITILNKFIDQSKDLF